MPQQPCDSLEQNWVPQSALQRRALLPVVLPVHCDCEIPVTFSRIFCWTQCTQTPGKCCWRFFFDVGMMHSTVQGYIYSNGLAHSLMLIRSTNFVMQVRCINMYLINKCVHKARKKWFTWLFKTLETVQIVSRWVQDKVIEFRGAIVGKSGKILVLCWFCGKECRSGSSGAPIFLSGAPGLRFYTQYIKTLVFS